MDPGLRRDKKKVQAKVVLPKSRQVLPATKPGDTKNKLNDRPALDRDQKIFFFFF